MIFFKNLLLELITHLLLELYGQNWYNNLFSLSSIQYGSFWLIIIVVNLTHIFNLNRFN